ncbi:MAG: hypothetical protein HY869_17775 [Chloroflexi bacterium]|nr:hypothetical protein [Chloroflexota bacterium]
MNSLSLELTQTINSILQTIITLAGIFFIIKQLRQVEMSIKGEAHDMLSMHMREILAVFKDFPNLRPYFYENKPIDEKNPNYDQVMIISEYYLDLFEHVIQKRMTLPSHLWDTWENYIHRLYKSSPAIRAFIAEHHDMYTKEVLMLTLLSDPLQVLDRK